MVLGSTLLDHTSYWLSRGDFVGRVVQVLDRCAGVGLFVAAADDRVARGRRNFVRCVHLLRLLRWSSLLGLLIPVLKFDTLLAEGKSFAQWLQAQKVGSVEKFMAALQASIEWMAARLTGSAPIDDQAVAGVVLLALLTVATVHVWNRIVRYWWDHMANLALAPVFLPSTVMPAAVKQVLVAIFVTAIGLLPLVFGVTWTLAPDLLSLRSLDTLLNMAAVIAVVIIYLLMVAGCIALTIHWIRGDVNVGVPPRARSGIWIVALCWLFWVIGGGFALHSILSN